MAAIPRFQDLPSVPGTEEKHAWDVWGREDQIGSQNRVGPRQVLQACRTIEQGRVISLTLPLDEPNPGLFPNRKGYQHTVTRSRGGRDDSLDSLYLHFSSHVDALAHVRFRQHGYWGGREEDELDADGSLGIEHWAARGIFARGVLLDVLAYQEHSGTGLDPERRFAIDGTLLDRIARAENVTLEPGDFLLLRTGWMEWYRSLPEEQRVRLQGKVGQGDEALATPGLDGTQATAEWVWDNGLVGIAADNVAVEALPVDAAAGFQHRRLIPLLGITLGEFWWLRELAQACSDLGRHAFLLSVSPLKLPGGIGSPANAYAIL